MNLATGVNITVHAPGCYSHASVFRHNNPICKACPAFVDCSNAVEAKLKAFSQKVDVSDHVTRHGNGKLEMGIMNELVIEPAVINLPDVPVRKQVVAKVKKVFSQEELSFLELLPKKVQMEARKLMERDEASRMLPCMLKGENPFPFEGRRFLHVACNMVIKGGFTKTSLRQEYMTQLGWSKETAFSHVSIIVGLFKAFNLITEDKNGNFALTVIG